MNRTYNDALINERSREVFMLCLSKGKALIESEQFNPEKVHAIAALADAAACGFEPDDEEEID